MSAYHAPLGLLPRASDKEIAWQASQFRDPLIQVLLDSVSTIVLVLNRQRQIVFVNRHLLDMLELEDATPILGLRPGELFSCEHAKTASHGCGTGEACQECGALKVILTGLEDLRAVEECRLSRRGDKGMEAFDLRVCGAPFHHQGDHYVVFSIADISHEKRRRALERIFFHDILNTTGSLRNLLELMLEEQSPEAFHEEARLLHSFFHGMVEEIQAQKMLLEAENNDLTPQMQWLQSRQLLDVAVNAMRQHEAANGKRLEIAPDSVDLRFESDITLLRRVLGNMLKNALEAEPMGATVRAAVRRCDDHGPHLCFEVHNDTVIPPGAALQIFQRSFSTKGAGRGLGTYSIKLLAERYLGGSAAFTSAPGLGTSFRVCLPLPS